MPSPVYAVNPSASDSAILEYEFSGFTVQLTYQAFDGHVIEKSVFIENGQTVQIIERIAYSDGEIRTYLDGELIQTIDGDYNAFLQAANDPGSLGTEPVEEAECSTRTIYELCGSTLYHDLVTYTEETIDTQAQGFASWSITSLTQFLVSKALGGTWAFWFGVATSIISIFNNSNYEYVDIREWKYYVYSYETSQAVNCYHVYTVCYNITDSGSRQVVDAEWRFYEVAL